MSDDIKAKVAETVKRWAYCPECGCTEVHYEEGDHKQCAKCGQEWFVDIDYSAVVRMNLEALAADRIEGVEAERDDLQELNRENMRQWAAAIDRAEAAEAALAAMTQERDELQKDFDGLDAASRTLINEARSIAEAAEARLAKAVEALRVLLATAYADDHAGWQDALKEARATLAEIGGGKKDE